MDLILPLEEVVRLIARSAQRQPGKAQLRNSSHVRGLVVAELERVVPQAQLARPTAAADPRPGAKNAGGILALHRRAGRMRVSACRRERVLEARMVRPDAHVVLAAHLVIEAPETRLVRVLAGEGPHLPGQERRLGDRSGQLGLVLERAKKVELVAHDRATERPADLFIRIGQNAFRDGIGGVQFVVTEKPEPRAIQVVRSGLRDGPHLNAGRPSFRDVEQLGDDLEFGNRFLTELRLAVPSLTQMLGHLLTVEVQLEQFVAADARRGRDVVRRDPFHQHRQCHPVPTLQRK